jgi:hypothetical protein
MWCATLQRCLELRLEEHAPILHSETGRQVFRKYKNVLVNIVQLGNYHLRSWTLLSVYIRAYSFRIIVLLIALIFGFLGSRSGNMSISEYFDSKP